MFVRVLCFISTARACPCSKSVTTSKTSERGRSILHVTTTLGLDSDTSEARIIIGSTAYPDV